MHKKCEGTQWGKDDQMEWPRVWYGKKWGWKSQLKETPLRECLISLQKKNIYHRCDKYYLGLLNMELT